MTPGTDDNRVLIFCRNFLDSAALWMNINNHTYTNAMAKKQSTPTMKRLNIVVIVGHGNENNVYVEELFNFREIAPSLKNDSMMISKIRNIFSVAIMARQYPISWRRYYNSRFANARCEVQLLIRLRITKVLHIYLRTGNPKYFAAKKVHRNKRALSLFGDVDRRTANNTEVVVHTPRLG